MVKYIKMDGSFNPIKEINIPQRKLSAECWLIQFNGLEACKGCELLNTEECGGKQIRKTMKNNLGFSIPLEAVK